MRKQKIILMILAVFLVFLTPLINAQTINNNFLSEVNLISFNSTEGNLTNTYFQDELDYRVYETNLINALEYDLIFNDINGDVTRVFINAHYLGGAGHIVEFSIKNCVTDNYDLLETYGNKQNNEYSIFDIGNTDYYCENNTATFKLKHSDNGVLGHYFDIDYISVQSLSSDVVIVPEFKFFDLNIDDTLTIVLIILGLIAGGLLVVLGTHVLVGGGLISLIGLILLFSGGGFIFGLITLVLGIGSILTYEVEE